MSSQAQPSTGLSTGGIVGISIVLVVGAALLLAGLVWMRRRKRRAQAAAAAGGLEAAKQQQEQQLPPVNSPSNPSELAGDGSSSDRVFRELEAPLRPPSRDPHPPLPHRDPPQAPPSQGRRAPGGQQDAGGGVEQQQRQQAAHTASDADASPPPRPPKEPISPRDGGGVNEAAEPPALVSGPIEMQAEDWPRPTGVVLPPEPKSAPAPEQKSIPRELSATRPQQGGPSAEM